MRSKGRIAIAMSGGVDSAVSASLLLEAGYDPVGMIMMLKDGNGSSTGTSQHYRRNGVDDAMNVARHIGIPAHVIDLRKEFHEKIYTYFHESYLAGKTPNPCILCNSELKFGILMKKASEMGIEKIATGHYARISHCDSKSRYLLQRGIDDSKDQAYFLFNLKQEQLSKVVLPIGAMWKNEVRRKAESLQLLISKRNESQDVCFLAERDYRSAYAGRCKDMKGDIVDSSGNILGKHVGVHNFTIGQRRGLGISHRKPLYVVRIDPVRNLVVVGEDEELLKDRMDVAGINWISWENPPEEVKAVIRIRSTHQGESGTIRRIEDDCWRVSFDRSVKGVAAGQAAVFYNGDEVLGGGWIL